MGLFDDSFGSLMKRTLPLSCPFCGSVAYLDKKRRKKYPYAVICGNVNCCCRTARWNTADGAIRAWNRRIGQE